MAHMLVVATGEFRHPVAFLIAVIAGDRLLHKRLMMRGVTACRGGGSGRES